MQQEIQSENPSPIWPIFLIVAVVALLTINISASRLANQFGMTAPELMKEFYLLLLYAIVSMGLVRLVGYFHRLPGFFRLGLRLAIMTATIAVCYNQIAISRELAPVKKEFASAASTCRVTPGGELKCGGRIDQVITERQQKLAELSAVICGDWKVKGSHKLNWVETGAIYFFSPF